MIRLCSLLLFAALLRAQAALDAPVIGCAHANGRAWNIAGVPSNWVALPAEQCHPVANPWRIRVEDDRQWAERVNEATGAIEARIPLEPGAWAVFPDGSQLSFDSLVLPAAVDHWTLVSPEWLLARAGEAWLLISRDEKWFYLPLPEEALAE